MARPTPPKPPGPWTELSVLCAKDGHTLTSLAAAAGMSQSYMCQLARGDRTPSPKWIARIARVLDVPVSMLTPDYLRLSGLPKPDPVDEPVDIPA